MFESHAKNIIILEPLSKTIDMSKTKAKWTSLKKKHTKRKLRGPTVNRAVEYGSIVPLVVIKTTFYKE